jgi:chemoreceptor-like protein with four helix bundle sensory module
MNNRIFSGRDEETSTLRQLKILVAVLIISNVALGIFAFYFLRTVDRKYSTLIDQTVRPMNDMQELTALIGAAMHSTNPTLFGGSAESRAEMLQRAGLALKHDRDVRNQILQREWLAADSDDRLKFQNAGEAFSKVAEETITLLGSGRTIEAGQQREQFLRPVRDRYVAATTQAADALEAQSRRYNDMLTARTSSLSNMMLGLASWPLMILATLLLVTALFVIVVLLNVFLFRRDLI